MSYKKLLKNFLISICVLLNSLGDKLALAQIKTMPAMKNFPILQRRACDPAYAYGLGLGGILADPFSKGLGLTGNIDYYFDHHWGWRALDLLYSQNFYTQFQSTLQSATLSDIKVPQIQYTLGTALILKPFYGKMNTRRGAFFHFEIFSFLGPKLAVLEDLALLEGLSIGPEWGLRVRLFSSPNFAVYSGFNQMWLWRVQNFSLGSLHNIFVAVGLEYLVPRKT